MVVCFINESYESKDDADRVRIYMARVEEITEILYSCWEITIVNGG